MLRRCYDRVVQENEVYAAIGEEGFERLVSVFYGQVRGDDVLGPMYPPGDMAGAEKRLREFLIFRFGGPPRYIEERGHPRLRMRHAGFAIGEAAKDRWLVLMRKSLDAAALEPGADAVLRGFFESTASFLINRDG